LAESEAGKSSFGELIAFSRPILTDIAKAWSLADLDQRQRVQTALFPGGLKYDREKGILSSGNNSPFSQLKFLYGKVGFGGPGRDRTDDLFHAMEARSQLRHRPTGGTILFSWSRTDSSTNA
jgi:hypothetical protein